MENVKTERIVLEIEWNASGDEKLDLPSFWDWKRIKGPMNLEKVKYLGTLSSVTKSVDENSSQ